MKNQASNPLNWKTLPTELQAALAEQALRKAAMIIAEQAELFAVQFEGGALRDRGGPDALRLFGSIIRETNSDAFPTMGNA